MTGTTAVMVCGQSHLDAKAALEFDKLTLSIAGRLSDKDVASGVFGTTGPSLRPGIERLINQGATNIVCVAGLLPTSNLTNAQLLAEINNIAADHSDVTFLHSRDLAIDGKILAAARDRIEACETVASKKIGREDTLLMVVGHGADNADANSNVAKVARMLWEGMGFGWAEVSYANNAFPSVDEGLGHAVKLGFKRIIVFPYYLFSETDLDSIYKQANIAATDYPNIDFLNASHLSEHEPLLDCFLDRINEAIGGSNSMNCMQCTYREQVTGPDHDHHEHDHAHGHDHGHTHPSSVKE